LLEVDGVCLVHVGKSVLQLEVVVHLCCCVLAGQQQQKI
jgi:hypothetical protein